MSLLCVTIKKARLGGTLDDYHTYVTVKLQNVKSTTVAVRGRTPSWEQEFIFETNRIDQGLMIELWNKGVLWDKLIGVSYLPLTEIEYSAIPGNGKWLQIDQDLVTKNGQTVGTANPTGHVVLADVRFELPFDAQSSNVQQQIQATRLHDLNQFEEAESPPLAPAVPQQQQNRAPFVHSGISEDSDYTSDVSFPIHHQNNSSTHQWHSYIRPSHNDQFQVNNEDEEDAYHRRMEDNDFDDNLPHSHHQNYEEDNTYYQSPPEEVDHKQPPLSYYHSYPATTSSAVGGRETRNYGNFTVTTEESQTPTEFGEDERYNFPMDSRYPQEFPLHNNHHQKHYDHPQMEESDEYDAEMEDYLPPEPSGRPVGHMYDSEGDYSLPQQRYDSQSGASSTTVERRYDSGSEYGNSRGPPPDIYHYDSSEYPSTIEAARYPQTSANVPGIVDKNYVAQLVALERRYDSYTSDDAGTSTSIFSHDSKNPRTPYMGEQSGATFTTPTPTEDFPISNGPVSAATTEYEHYENEGYIDPMDIRHPSDYNSRVPPDIYLSYNSRPPGGQIRRRSSVLSPTNEISPKEIISSNSKPLNGYLPNGYGNNNISETSSSSVFPMMSQQQQQQSSQRRQSDLINEQQQQQQKPKNSFDLPQDPHDYEKEYAVYNDIQKSVSPENNKQPFR
jgi:hypothetical protein